MTCSGSMFGGTSNVIGSGTAMNFGESLEIKLVRDTVDFRVVNVALGNPSENETRHETTVVDSSTLRPIKTTSGCPGTAWRMLWTTVYGHSTC